jgi:hypothetical protein
MVMLSAVIGSSWLVQVSWAVEGTLVEPVNDGWVLDGAGLPDNALVLFAAEPLLAPPCSVLTPQPAIPRSVPMMIRFR